ncbi:hypothetical protein T265_08975 [Opisthorchis viverrini]|uniref:Elongation of very long chain fatty acids protein n=1 Tax=Opisthorchis viverrini TaxID=6198 RepID=A0A074Z7B3_OPIVI|nr:hypothetical protein T265_08975 [Opisthorchis viverrini]KER23076.1 hypothetical protein T265_08975 [Opisthorchis viverrini]
MTEASIFSSLSGILPPQPDPRADTYPLMQSWTPTALISLAYVVGVCAWRAELIKRGQVQKKLKIDADRPKSTESMADWDPLKYLIILYNVVMVFYSAYVVILSVYHAANLGYGLGCVEAPDPTDKKTDILVYIGYLFYFSKFVEMLDTVFFLCRGKVDQVTFLHVFHHAAMPPSIWWGLKYAPVTNMRGLNPVTFHRLFARPSVVPQQVFVLATNDKTSVQPVAINNVELNQTIDVSLTPKTKLACICDEKSSQPGGSWNAALADRFKVVYQTVRGVLFNDCATQ